jgi:hypothetical protein
LPEVIKKPWISNPPEILIREISKVCEKARVDIKSFGTPESMDTFSWYGEFLLRVIEQELHDKYWRDYTPTI